MSTEIASAPTPTAVSTVEWPDDFVEKRYTTAELLSLMAFADRLILAIEGTFISQEIEKTSFALWVEGSARDPIWTAWVHTRHAKEIFLILTRP